MCFADLPNVSRKARRVMESGVEKVPKVLKPTQESSPESASSKLVKKFFISTPGSNSLRQDDCEALSQEHKGMYGNCYCFGIDEKKSVDILKVIREVPVEM
jgi:hypothetical protein